GRSSGEYDVSARAMARRSAPACPAAPPPCSSATMSNCSSRSTATSGALTSCWWTLLGKYSSRGRPSSVNCPERGTSRTRATASLRRPTACAGPAVQRELSGARHQPDPRHGFLATADSLRRTGHDGRIDLRVDLAGVLDVAERVVGLAVVLCDLGRQVRDGLVGDLGLGGDVLV